MASIPQLCQRTPRKVVETEAMWITEASQSSATTTTPPAGTEPSNRSPDSSSTPEAWTDADEREWLMAKRKLRPSSERRRVSSTPGSAAATGAAPDSSSNWSTIDSIPSRSGNVARYQAAPAPTDRLVKDGTPSSG